MHQKKNLKDQIIGEDSLLLHITSNFGKDMNQGLIKEKFVIHSNTMAKDVMEHFTSRRHYMAYFLSVIDWMNANGYPLDKDAWVKETYLNLANKGQYTQAFYKMEEQWNRVKDDANFIAAHQSSMNRLELPYEMEWLPVDEVFARSDFLSLNCPLTPDTENLVNAERLQKMKSS